MSKKPLSVIITIAILVAFSSVATAQTRAGLVKIHLDTSLFGFGVGEEDYDDDNINDRDYDQITVGLGTPSAGIGGGYTVIDGLVVGGKVAVALDGWDKYHFDSGGFTWSIMPYVEYIWLAGIFRPFVIGTLGFEGFFIDDNVIATNQKKHWWNFTFGGGGGAHFFLYDRISLDATLLFTFGVGTGEREISLVNRTVTDDFTHWRFLFMTLIGISVWL